MSLSQVQVIDEALFRSVAERASSTPRKRLNHNFHANSNDNPHRFLNVLLRGTYVRPHRHASPPKAESFLVLQGAAEVIVFDEGGTIAERYRLGLESAQGRVWGVDLPPCLWHTIVTLSDVAVCFEVKPGPWDAASDKEFAPWAPEEGTPQAVAYLRTLLATPE